MRSGDFVATHLWKLHLHTLRPCAGVGEDKDSGAGELERGLAAARPSPSHFQKFTARPDPAHHFTGHLSPLSSAFAPDKASRAIRHPFPYIYWPSRVILKRMEMHAGGGHAYGVRGGGVLCRCRIYVLIASTRYITGRGV